MKHTLSNKGVEIGNNLNEDLKSIKFYQSFKKQVKFIIKYKNNNTALYYSWTSNIKQCFLHQALQTSYLLYIYIIVKLYITTFFKILCTIY